MSQSMVRRRGFLRIHEYWKQGFYRSTSPDLVSVLYHSGLVRADSFAAAEFAAFATHGGKKGKYDDPEQP